VVSRATGRPVVVVGAGIAGVACARELSAAGVEVQVRERARTPGGRMASSVVESRMVDKGASYFTCSGPGFRRVVDDWVARGLARPWTDRFPVLTPDGLSAPKPGPVRYASPRGLRALVADLATGLDVRYGADVADVGPGPQVDGEPAAAVVLAMPDPQALDVLAPELPRTTAAATLDWTPSLSLAAAWHTRQWPDLDGAFVSDSVVLSWVADDGRRRGDGAPVLVAHSTPEFAAPRLDDPPDGIAPMLRALRGLLDIPDPPRWVSIQRWSLSAPASVREQPYFLSDELVGLCGDGWGAPKVETAWQSGTDLGAALAARLGGGR